LDTIHTRLKTVRTNLNLTTLEFSSKLDISRSAITNMEKGNRNVTMRTVNQICLIFNISESWLKNGEGSMFDETNTFLLNQLYDRYNLDELEQTLLLKFLTLEKDQRSFVKSFLAQSFFNEILERKQISLDSQDETCATL
jgi:transcriptional regulator with XRE-family HTH domain